MGTEASSPRRRPTAGPPTVLPVDRTAVLPTALTLLMIVAVIVAAGFLGDFSADPVLDAGVSSPAPEVTPAPTATTTTEPPLVPEDRIEIDGGTLVAFVLIVLTAGLALLVRYLRRFRVDRSEEKYLLDPKDLGREGALNLAEERLPAWSGAALVLLEADTDTSDVVIRCWMDLERHCAAAGLPRRRTQTASDFASMVSDAVGLPPGPLAELTGLYQRARFARSPGGTATLRPGDRRRASAALEDLSAALRSGRDGDRPPSRAGRS